jgi:hypothetical protein
MKRIGRKERYESSLVQSLNAPTPNTSTCHASFALPIHEGKSRLP